MLETGTDYCNANARRFCHQANVHTQTRVLPTAQHGGESNHPNQSSSLVKSGKGTEVSFKASAAKLK